MSDSNPCKSTSCCHVYIDIDSHIMAQTILHMAHIQMAWFDYENKKYNKIKSHKLSVITS